MYVSRVTQAGRALTVDVCILPQRRRTVTIGASVVAQRHGSMSVGTRGFANHSGLISSDERIMPHGRGFIGLRFGVIAYGDRTEIRRFGIRQVVVAQDAGIVERFERYDQIDLPPDVGVKSARPVAVRKIAGDIRVCRDHVVVREGVGVVEPFKSMCLKNILSHLDVVVTGPIRVREVGRDIGVPSDARGRIVGTLSSLIGPSRGHDEAAEAEKEEQSDQAYGGKTPARRVRATSAGAGRGL